MNPPGHCGASGYGSGPRQVQPGEFDEMATDIIEGVTERQASKYIHLNDSHNVHS
jgi:hypothetical protein